MTGFGKAEFENENFKIEVEVKSLNSKVFDFKIKFPNVPAEKEMHIRNIVSQKAIRGKIDCNIKLDVKENSGKFKINEQVFDKYFKQFSLLNKKYGTFVEEVNFYQILMNFPEVIESDETVNEEVWNYVYEAVEKALQDFDNFRLQEGKATEKVFLNSIDNIAKNLSIVPKFEQERIDNLKNKIRTSLEESQLSVDNDRFESEIIYYIEKFDINEEKSRLKNHLKYFKETIEEEASGKKLNFIAQEMGREINTLGSKANHFEIQKLVVSMKDELEKIKEQVLNVL